MNEATEVQRSVAVHDLKPGLSQCKAHAVNRRSHGFSLSEKERCELKSLEDYHLAVEIKPPLATMQRNPKVQSKQGRAISVRQQEACLRKANWI